MKTLRKLKFNILIMFFSVAIISCGEDDTEQSAEEVNMTKIANEWIVGENGEVRRDNNLITTDFQNFTIKFAVSNTYVVQNDPLNVFQPSGTWRFAEDSFSEIILNSDQRPVNVEFSDEDEILILRFSIEDDRPMGSRMLGLSGSYEFQLSK